MNNFKHLKGTSHIASIFQGNIFLEIESFLRWKLERKILGKGDEGVFLAIEVA